MSITEELRRLTFQMTNEEGNVVIKASDLYAIANRINAEHKAAVDKAHADGERNALQQHRSASEDYRRGYEAGKADGFDEGFASADDWLAEHADAMAEHGWIRLPKDADGEPIHVGDKVTEHEDGHTFKVDGFMDWGGEWWVFMRDGIQAPASRCTHYHAPTVEDVLREFVYAILNQKPRLREKNIAEYAAKLRLKEVDA